MGRRVRTTRFQLLQSAFLYQTYWFVFVMCAVCSAILPHARKLFKQLEDIVVLVRGHDSHAQCSMMFRDVALFPNDFCGISAATY